MSRRSKKIKNNRNYNNPHYRKYSRVATPKDVFEIAFKVFGSLYYTPNK